MKDHERAGRHTRPRQRDGGEAPASSRGEGGFALLVALLAIVGLTAMATGGFLLSNTDTKMTRSYGAAATAFYMADAGLKRFLGTQDGEPTTTTASYTFTDGTADVTATELVAVGDGKRVWQIESVGRPNPPDDQIQRRVSTIALLDPVVITPPAGVVAAGTWFKGGNAGKVSGNDESTSSDCPEGGEDQAGVYTWKYEGDPDPADGDPPIVETEPENPYEFLADSIGWGVDWESILSGTEISFDYVVDDFKSTAEGWVPTDFPSLTSDEWPVIFVDYDGIRDGSDADEIPTVDDTVRFTPDCCSGQGVVIAEESLELGGSWSWDGLIMTGGVFESEGNNTYRGGIMAGLNTTLPDGASPAPTDSELENTMAEGNKDYQYNTCHLFTAAREAGDLEEVSHTWAEVF